MGITTSQSLPERIHGVLPQTQCKRCGYPDCMGYAQALAEGQADINQCPPGGAEGVQRLAALTGRPAKPIDPDFGAEGPRTVAFIDENWCIGCTLCIKACPVDAIIGIHKHMHTVLEQHCTGCELCLPVCPVDCILLENASGNATGWQAWSEPLASQARTRYAAHVQRGEQEAQEHQSRQQAKAEHKLADLATHSRHTDPVLLEQKRAIIQTALERAKVRRNSEASTSS